MTLTTVIADVALSESTIRVGANCAGRPMATYQLLCLEAGRVVERSAIDADSDAEALTLPALQAEKTDCELWNGERLVATISRGADPRFVHCPDAIMLHALSRPDPGSRDSRTAG